MKRKSFLISSILTLFFSVQVALAQEEILNSLINTVSPVEITDLIKKQGIVYQKNVLHNPGKISDYQSDFKKAVNLGVYSTDLGYASIYEQNADALGFLGSVKKMADGLNVGSFINFNKILTLAQNKNDLNKLLDETSTTYENMSNHLEKQKKSNLAALMLIGGWLETLYITCEVARKQPNQELNNRIVDQKLILVQILQVMKAFQTDASTKSLTNDLNNLNTLLSTYKVETGKTTKGEKKKIIVGGQEIEVDEDDNQTQDVKLSPQDLNKIAGMVAEIRSAIIK